MRQWLRQCTILLLLCASPILFHVGVVHAKEVEVTKEWQLLGENDTIPAGMHVRMDMTTGEKWVKQIDENEDKEETGVSMAIQEDGSVQMVPEEKKEDVQEASKEKEETTSDSGYDFEMMHRTLSKLPPEEKQRMGGIPELPTTTSSSNSKTILTAQERRAFEKRMVEIWEQRQAELKELEEAMMDVPEVLKQRIKSIRNYLKDPTTHLKKMNLEKDVPPNQVTHIVSVLQDLEFQLGDLDMSRDFHTLGGWPLLASLVSENVHVPQNKTISKLSRRIEGKIRTVQTYAAWAIGTAVKNTEEFFHFAIEPFTIPNVSKTTAIDQLIQVFCQNYKDPGSYEVRRLLEKAIYSIGSLLRGNRLSQAHIVTKTDGAALLGKTFLDLASDSQHPSGSFKVLQKLLSLASDIVTDITLHGDAQMGELNTQIINSFSSKEWCDATAHIVVADSFLAAPVQQTLLETVQVLAPHCAWLKNKENLKKSILGMKTSWDKQKTSFDPEHLEQLKAIAETAIESLEKSF